MPQVCWYFQLHQPYRLKPFSVFDVGHTHQSYFADSVDQDDNRIIFQKVAHKSYLPMLSLLLRLVQRHKKFSFALSVSGVFVEQAKEYQPEVISLLKKLARTGQVEFLSETYYHSLASLYTPEEFAEQVDLHRDLLKKEFGVTPHVFRNTELIYSNQIAELVQQQGFVGMLTEAVTRYLGTRSKTQVFKSYTPQPLPLLLKHAELSDDIAFRFSDTNWEMHPVTVDKFLTWLHQYGQDEVVNLFMDFETFGEHQWEDTGIFAFFEALIDKSLEHSWNSYKTPLQLLLPYHQHQRLLRSLPVYDVPEPISWADLDRDLTAWRDTSMQWDSLRLLYQLEQPVKSAQAPFLLDTWRKLQTSDHFYYMCTKWAADGDVHAYFSPYDTPLEAYNRFAAVLADFQHHLREMQLPVVFDASYKTK